MPEMTVDQKISVLENAKSLLTEKGWTRFVFFAQDKDGETVALTDPNSPAADRFCLMGAVFRAAGLEVDSEAVNEAEIALYNMTADSEVDESYWSQDDLNESITQKFMEPIKSRAKECSLATALAAALPDDFVPPYWMLDAEDDAQRVMAYNDNVLKDANEAADFIQAAIDKLKEPAV